MISHILSDPIQNLSLPGQKRARPVDLAQQSLHRKTAALVDSVAAVLRVKLGKKGRISEGLGERLKEAEANLRAVAGKFHEASEFYREAAGQVRDLGPSTDQLLSRIF